MKTDSLSVLNQESLLAGICFNNEIIKFSRNVIDSSVFTSFYYRKIAERVIAYYDTHKCAPGDHLPEILDDYLESRNNKEANIYKEILHNVFETSSNINPNFVQTTLEKFIRKQEFIKGISKAAELIDQDKLDDAEVVIEKVRKKQLSVFQPGLILSDSVNIFNALDNQPEVIPCGIPYLENIDFGLTKGESLLVTAPKGKGKTWMLMHLAKMALLARQKVLHLTLEMSQNRCVLRYVQSLFSISKRSIDRLKIAEFLIDKKGAFNDVDFYELEKRPSLQDYNIREIISDNIEKYKGRINLTIKHFPTSSLTINGLNAYLDMLENQSNYKPDVLIIDYADLMCLEDSSRTRESTSLLHKQLRGLAEERDIALGTASQSNRAAEDVRVITSKHLGEDYSKGQTADMHCTYNQTDFEKRLGLARLYIDKARNDTDGDQVLISQAYQIGQFCLDSTLLAQEYWDSLKSLGYDQNNKDS